VGKFESEPGNTGRLRAAALLLAGTGPVKQRLCDACLRHLAEVEPAELPRELAAPYRELMDALRTVQPVGGLGAVEATIRKMSDLDAAGYSARVLELFVALSVREARDPAASPQRQLRLVGDD
jgi:hypothetical protein